MHATPLQKRCVCIIRLHEVCMLRICCSASARSLAEVESRPAALSASRALQRTTDACFHTRPDSQSIDRIRAHHTSPPHPFIHTSYREKKEKMSSGAPYGRSSSQSRERARFEDAFRVYHEVGPCRQSIHDSSSKQGVVCY